MLDLATHPQPVKLWLAATPAHGGEEDPDTERAARAKLRSLRVLIVEDEFFISLHTKALLQALGHTVVGMVVSADEAVSTAEREKPDVVLMDIRLPGPRDGIDAADEIYARWGVPSVFVTANTDPLTRQRAAAINLPSFVEKPLTEDRLRQALNTISPRQRS